MGAAGGVHFFQTTAHPDIDAALRRFITASGVQRIQSVSRTPEKTNRLRWIMNGLPYREERLGEQLLPEDVPQFYRRWWVTRIWLWRSRWIEALFQATAAHPELDWGDCCLCDLFVSVGWKDMIDTAGDDALLVARAFLDVRVYAEGYPGHSRSLGEALPGLPIIQEFKGVVEGCFGPVETCVLWSF